MQEINRDAQTIAAVATAVAPGQGGIAVIRLSGPQAQAAHDAGCDVRPVVRPHTDVPLSVDRGVEVPAVVDLGVEPTAKLRYAEVTAPAARAAGQIVDSAEALVDKLATEAKVL